MASIGSRRGDEAELNLKEWALKARIVSRENSRSRRFSGSHVPSFREEAAAARPSFRTNVIISSTASSPGYTLRDEINPSTYSFTNALKALQAKTVYSWEYMSPEGYALNSKWDEAEKYISNPLSGEVPFECLSSKTLSATSFRNLTSRITMSAPLIYPSLPHLPPTPTVSSLDKNLQVHIQEKKMSRRSMTRDVGTQSVVAELSSISSSPSPAPTPSIKEGSIRRHDGDSPLSGENLTLDLPSKKFESEAEGLGKEVAQKKVKEDETERGKEEKEEDSNGEKEGADRSRERKCRFRCRQGGCMSWSLYWMRRRKREKHKPTTSKKISIFLYHKSGC